MDDIIQFSYAQPCMFKPGDRVKVQRGHYEDYEGTVISLTKEKDIARIRFDRGIHESFYLKDLKKL